MNIAYFDCIGGISGDMALGALIDCGVPFAAWEKALRGLAVKGWKLTRKTVRRGHLTATRVHVDCGVDAHHHTTLAQVLALIEKSRIAPEVKVQAAHVVTLLGKAEARVHRTQLAGVHFHHLGETDTLIDVVGTVIGLRMLGVDAVYASPLPLARGSVTVNGETFPLPAPATVELLKKRTVNFLAESTHELVTPTGAALIAGLTVEAPVPLHCTVEAVGYGAGTHNAPQRTNVLRLVRGTLPSPDARDTIIELQTTIDDLSPVHYELIFERLFAAGALDVYASAVMMKKMRPGVLLSVLAEEARVEGLVRVIFEETSTLGVRMYPVSRRKAARKILNMRSEYGIMVNIKIGSGAQGVLNIAPEYEDCKRIAQMKKLPFKQVYERIKAQAIQHYGT